MLPLKVTPTGGEGAKGQSMSNFCLNLRHVGGRGIWTHGSKLGKSRPRMLPRPALIVVDSRVGNPCALTTKEECTYPMLPSRPRSGAFVFV